MITYNMKAIILFKNSMDNKEAYYRLGNFISFAMSKDDELKVLHETNKYKMYTFCLPYAIPKDGVYRAGSLYQFDIRAIDVEFVAKLKQLLFNCENEDFKIVMLNLISNEYRNIEKLVTLTPCIMTTDLGYKIPDDLEFVKKRITDNAQKKYKMIFGEDITTDFITNITKLNKVPIKIPYKKIFLLGNKFEFEVKSDEDAQKLAWIVFATGAAEKNSYGFGFCKAGKGGKN